MSTPISDLLNFLDYTANKGFLNANTVGARKTACRNLFEGLSADEANVEYVTENLDLVAHQFSTKNKEKFTAKTVEEYKSRVRNALNDFRDWTNDKLAWERGTVGKSKAGNAKPKEKQTESRPKQSQVARSNQESIAPSAVNDSMVRRLSFPIRNDFEVKVEIPSAGLTTSELNRLGLFLLPYCNDLSEDSFRIQNWGAVVKHS